MSDSVLPLHVVEDGVGPPLLVLHGFTGHHGSMQGVAGGLRDAYRVLRPDLIGHGVSPAPAEVEHYTMRACVDQLVDVLDRRELGAAHVLGYSMGGRAALALAAWHPERVRSLVLVGASAGLEEASEREARRRADEALADRIERDGVPAFVDAWMALPLFASQARLGAEALAAARAQRLDNRAHGLAGSLRGMGTGAQPPLHAALPSLAVPVLLAHGAEDAKFAAIAEALATRLPDARVVGVPDAGHACHLEAPAAFLASVRAFLQEQDARGCVPS